MAEAAHVESAAADEEETEFEVERDENNQLTGVKTESNYLVRRYSVVMVQADAGLPKFLGYVRELIETDDDIELRVGWFYRAADLQSSPSDLVICRARMDGKPAGGDKGRFKEIFLSNHTDTVSVCTIMDPIKVWLLPSESLEPLTVPHEAGPWDRGTLLPGFVCRRMYDTQRGVVFPLSEVLVPSRRKQLPSWVVEDVAELLRRSEEERREFMADWVRRCQARAERAALREQQQQQLQQAASGRSTPASSDAGPSSGPSAMEIG